MRMRERFRAVLVVVVIVATLLSLAPAGAGAGESDMNGAAAAAPSSRQALPDDRERFPPCSDERRQFCIVSFEMDTGGSGLFGPPPSDIVVWAELWASWATRDSLNLQVLLEESPDVYSQELAPTVPAGTAMRIVVNTGSWEPPPTMSSSARVQEWSRALGSDGWTMTFALTTMGSSISGACTFDDCSVERGDRDYVSRASAVVWAIAPIFTPEDTERIRELETGSWVATNASTFSNGYYDPEARSINFDLAGPHLTSTGELNLGFFSAFVPDALITEAWGADPEALARSNALVLIRSDDSGRERVRVDSRRVDGGVRIDYADFTYSSPTFSIQARRTLRAPRNVRVIPRQRRAVVRVAPMKAARSYEAECTRRNRVRTVESRRPRIVVRKLAAGRWTCQVRAIRVTAGEWSDEVTVRIRPRRS
ncbi:MAG: hypothetical protein ACE367_00565 [Acidimicrobiales bacterium]